MESSLIKVGNSRAVIIPAKTLRKLNITDDTRLNLEEESGTIVISKQPVALENLQFPKIDIEIYRQKAAALMEDLITIPKEDIENDERLAYILSR